MAIEQDLQETLSFRYVAPRIFMLSSGNIAICPMIGRGPPTIVEPKDFYDLCAMVPTTGELEALSRREDDAMRQRQEVMNSTRKSQASAEDLA